jgi:hypothetical protein
MNRPGIRPIAVFLNRDIPLSSSSVKRNTIGDGFVTTVTFTAYAMPGPPPAPNREEVPLQDRLVFSGAIAPENTKRSSRYGLVAAGRYY